MLCCRSSDPRARTEDGMSRRPVYMPPPKPLPMLLVKKRYRAQLSVTCYLEIEVWAADEPEARLTARSMASPSGTSITTRTTSESKAVLRRRCDENGFQLGGDWNVETVQEVKE